MKNEFKTPMIKNMLLFHNIIQMIYIFDSIINQLSVICTAKNVLNGVGTIRATKMLKLISEMNDLPHIHHDHPRIYNLSF